MSFAPPASAAKKGKYASTVQSSGRYLKIAFSSHFYV